MIYFNRNIYSKNNYIYEEDDEEYPTFINLLDNYNPMATISSSINNLKIVMSIEPKEKKQILLFKIIMLILYMEINMKIILF